MFTLRGEKRKVCYVVKLPAYSEAIAKRMTQFAEQRASCLSVGTAIQQLQRSHVRPLSVFRADHN